MNLFSLANHTVLKLICLLSTSLIKGERLKFIVSIVCISRKCRLFDYTLYGCPGVEV